ncbi:hypothetical protein [Massilia sp. H6]|uniref:hypothetical protein n=1 Tax=Massilia sp. H6 TaxID=2970464 RepID=UPI0021689E77|nr:hypothetical protein [Massilia sp. H6]UVW27186.1 hypothetical protein NRS07_11470 [Massilia sp. H6]
MTPKNTLWALLALMLATGMAEALYAAAHMTMPAWWILLSAFLLSFLPYYWYRQDSEARHFPRSRLMNTVVVGIGPVGIPVYLYCSRDKGLRLRALARMSGFVLAMVGAAAMGAIAFFLMPG